ncbi:tetratricopeptide repeat protein [Treponema endosymbiont of Eucomonympha sp.]|uniref:tetratricopeptide repeat protein n=1 Tax=Treponema endosymbiont of Eucomonympha sp. TaxID=1580831 RepID=UPI0007853835|nr:tetratricopeptide repeat protein [Treponema endosymbiont of Eucomonympha sp.]
MGGRVSAPARAKPRPCIHKEEEVTNEHKTRRIRTCLVITLAPCGFAKTADPNAARAAFDKGVLFAKRGDYGTAIECFTDALKLDPNLAAVYHNRGRVYHDKGDYDRALADYTQAIKLDPNDATVYSNRGAAYYSKGDYVRAAADFIQVIRLDPNNADAKMRLEMAQRHRQ